MNRRTLIVGGGALVVGGRATPAAAARKGEESGEHEEEVAPGEDLMREHGVLRRVMLVYDEATRRLETGEPPPAAPIAAGAKLVRRVIEDYHEKLEEDFLFPRFEKAGRLQDLVATLRAQHQAGRGVTEAILKLGGGPLRADADRKGLAALLRAFNRMYRPHAAREDTVLFPAFHELVGRNAYRELGESFEDREKKVLGKEGFEGAVREVAKLESEVGIADLAQFTPKPPATMGRK